MDFDLNDEQRLLADSVNGLLGDAYDSLDKHAAYQRESHGYSTAIWRQMAELGLLGLPFAEQYGGIDGGPTELMIVMEAIGRSLAIEPFLATVVLAGGLVTRAGTAMQKEALLRGIADGSRRLAFAHTEPRARYDLDHVETSAKRDDDGWILNGQKSVVLHGDSADTLIVSVRTAGNRNDTNGITLFLVAADANGVTTRGYPTQDGQRAAELTLSNVRVPADARLGPQDEASPIIAATIDAALAALCAEAIGAMDALHALTVDYIKTRKQFGVAIGSFQALQHRAVDMMTALEQARSMTYYATMMVGTPEARAAIAGAKVQVNEASRYVGQQAIQLHGGIGMTMEYKAGHYFKRLTMIESLFGDTEHHLRTVTQAGGLIGAL